MSVAVLVTLVAACAGRRAAGTPIERDLAVETFDAAWRIVHETHFDTTFNGVDWVALRGELRPQAREARTVDALRQVIGEMLRRLGQSHFVLIPRELADTLDPANSDREGGGRSALDEVGDLGLEVRLVDNQVLVSQVDATGPAWALGVRPGWVVTEVEGLRVAELVRRMHEAKTWMDARFRVASAVMGRFAGRTGTQCRVAFLDGGDRPVTLTLTRRRDPSQPVKFGNLPTFFARFESRKVEAPETGVRAGVIWFNFWMAPILAQVDRAVDEFRGLDGIVLDLRGNRGGLGVMVMGVGGHFLDDRVLLGVMKTRTTDLALRANPRRVDTRGRPVRPFAGPVAILIDPLTGSASELFAGGMQSIGRARIFGERSVGGVLPAAMDRLPNGDVLFHAFAEFVTATGDRLEGRGVTPDEVVPLTRSDLLAGADLSLEAALRWIATERARVSGAPNPMD